MIINPLTAIDFYKSDHRRQYPEGTTEVYSNFTPRSNKYYPQKCNEVVFFGLQYVIKYFILDCWNNEFFNKPKKAVVDYYKRRMNNSLGKDAIETCHIESLHDLGYLPIKIKALNEGSIVPFGVPVFTIVNTHPDFFWITNYLETALSSLLWKPITTATTAYCYKKLLKKYGTLTGIDFDFVKIQAHDFSFRGMSNVHDAALCGAAHLTSFIGTDSVPSIDLIERYYGGNSDREIIGCSVPATEHSVMCMGGVENELNFFKRLITEVYPSGIVSIVSDTWDFWKVITDYSEKLKELIINRDGKVVFRPDSGDPVKIICGDDQASDKFQQIGAVECLWNIFGGKINKSGFKELDVHVGLIYGDAITYERASHILKNLSKKGFASNNIVFGIGSYTYQYMTRDSLGFAMKATSGVVNGKRREIFKNPKTDSGIKKSACGLLSVQKDLEKGIFLCDKQTEIQEKSGLLEEVFINGRLIKEDNFHEIRDRIEEEIK